MTATNTGGFGEAPAGLEPENKSALKLRMLRHLFLRNSEIALAIISLGLAIGITGYHFVVGLPWLDALLNASMILAGMGPVDPIRTGAGKLFASFYALFSGLAMLAIATTYLQSGARIFLEHHGILPLRHEGRPPGAGQKNTNRTHDASHHD